MKTMLPRVLIVAGIALVAVFFWLFYNRDDIETVINKRLDEVVALVEVTGEESPFFIVGQARELQNYLSAEPRIIVGSPLPEINNRQEMIGIVAQFRQSISTMAVRIVNRSLDVAEDEQSAIMEVSAEATVTYAGEPGRERRRFRLEWILEEGEWVISRAELLEVEQRSRAF